MYSRTKRRIKPEDCAKYYIHLSVDPDGLESRFINNNIGRGVFALQTFAKGDFLLEYRGDVIPDTEAIKREALYKDQELGCFLYFYQDRGKHMCIDATHDSCLARLVNDEYKHPNGVMKKVVVEGKAHLCVFALNEIKVGDEVRYDYGPDDPSEHTMPWRYIKEDACTAVKSYDKVQVKAIDDAKAYPETESEGEKDKSAHEFEQQTAEKETNSLMQNADLKNQDTSPCGNDQMQLKADDVVVFRTAAAAGVDTFLQYDCESEQQNLSTNLGMDLALTTAENLSTEAESMFGQNIKDTLPIGVDKEVVVHGASIASETLRQSNSQTEQENAHLVVCLAEEHAAESPMNNIVPNTEQEIDAKFSLMTVRAADDQVGSHTVQELTYKRKTRVTAYLKYEDFKQQYQPSLMKFSSFASVNCDDDLNYGIFGKPGDLPLTADYKKKTIKHYCECCGIYYQNLKLHLMTSQHKAFATNENNYSETDSIISQLSLDSFVHSILNGISLCEDTSVFISATASRTGSSKPCSPADENPNGISVTTDALSVPTYTNPLENSIPITDSDSAHCIHLVAYSSSSSMAMWNSAGGHPGSAEIDLLIGAEACSTVFAVYDSQNYSTVQNTAEADMFSDVELVDDSKSSQDDSAVHNLPRIESQLKLKAVWKSADGQPDPAEFDLLISAEDVTRSTVFPVYDSQNYSKVQNTAEADMLSDVEPVDDSESSQDDTAVQNLPRTDKHKRLKGSIKRTKTEIDMDFQSTGKTQQGMLHLQCKCKPRSDCKKLCSVVDQADDNQNFSTVQNHAEAGMFSDMEPVDDSESSQDDTAVQNLPRTDKHKRLKGSIKRTKTEIDMDFQSTGKTQQGMLHLQCKCKPRSDCKKLCSVVDQADDNQNFSTVQNHAEAGMFSDMEPVDDTESSQDDTAVQNLPRIDKHKRLKSATRRTETELRLLSKRKPPSDCKKSYDKIHYCLYCKKAIVSKMARHLLYVHKYEDRVKEIISLPPKCSIRVQKIQMLVNEGNFEHNVTAMGNGAGQIVVGRRSTVIGKRVSDYTVCSFCKKFQSKKNLWRHSKKCHARISYFDKHGHSPSQRRLMAVRSGQSLIARSVFDSNDDGLNELLTRMKDDEIRAVVMSDELIRREGALRMSGLGRPDDRKQDDIYRVSHCVRTLARVVHLTRTSQSSSVTLSDIIVPEKFDVVVCIGAKMTFDKDKPALHGGKTLANYLRSACDTKYCSGLRSGNRKAQEEATDFKKLIDAEWNKRVNRPALLRARHEKRNKLPVIPVTDDLKLFREFLVRNIAECIERLVSHTDCSDWLLLAKCTMTRLLLFNGRRRNEVREMKVSDYLSRPSWHTEGVSEMEKALSVVDRILAKRMDMVLSAGKSSKNNDAYVLFPPGTTRAIDVLIEKRSTVGISESNIFVFARMNGNSSMAGHTEMQELAHKCDGLTYPERMSSRHMRTYIATVCQLLDMNETDLGHLSRHLGHDAKTHKEFYRLTHSTVQLSKIARLLLAVENGNVHQFRGKSLDSIEADELPDVESDDDNDEECTLAPSPEQEQKFDDSKEKSVAGEFNCDEVAVTRKKKLHRIVTLSGDGYDDNDKECTPAPSREQEQKFDDSKEKSVAGEFNCDEVAVTRKKKWHRIVTPNDTDSDKDELKETKMPQKIKHPKRRWTETETNLLQSTFGREITTRKMPTGVQIAELAKKLRTRTIPQIRTQLSNYIKGKRG